MGTEPHRSEGVATTGVALKTDSRQPAASRLQGSQQDAGQRERTKSKPDKGLNSVNP